MNDAISEFVRQWVAGTVTHVWGINRIWLSRVGDWMQTVAGLTIFIELIGKRRMDEIGARLARLMRRIAVYPTLQKTLRFAISGVKAQVFMLTAGFRGMDLDEMIARCWSESKTITCLTVALQWLTNVAVIYYLIFHVGWSWQLVWQIPLFHFTISLINTLALYAAFWMLWSAFVVGVALGGGALSLFVQILVRILDKRGLVHSLMVAAALLFVVGSLLKLISS